MNRVFEFQFIVKLRATTSSLGLFHIGLLYLWTWFLLGLGNLAQLWENAKGNVWNNFAEVPSPARIHYEWTLWGPDEWSASNNWVVLILLEPLSKDSRSVLISHTLACLCDELLVRATERNVKGAKKGKTWELSVQFELQYFTQTRERYRANQMHVCRHVAASSGDICSTNSSLLLHYRRVQLFGG